MRDKAVRIGLIKDESTVFDLTVAGITWLDTLLENDDPLATLKQINQNDLPEVVLS